MSYDEVQRTRELLLTRIARYGYAVTEVTPSQGNDRAYTYTTGLPRHMGHPELAVCGLTVEASLRVITSVVALLEETPEVEGRVLGAFANDRPCWIVPVPESMIDSYLGLAEWWRREHYDAGTAVVKQIIMCDRTGRFPWDHGCEPRSRGQSLLLPQIPVREPSTATPEESGDDSATG